MMFGTTGGIIEPFKSREIRDQSEPIRLRSTARDFAWDRRFAQSNDPADHGNGADTWSALDRIPRRLRRADDHRVNLDILRRGSGRRKSPRRNRCNNRIRRNADIVRDFGATPPRGSVVAWSSMAANSGVTVMVVVIGRSVHPSLCTARRIRVWIRRALLSLSSSWSLSLWW